MLTNNPSDPLTREIIGAAITVHRTLGAGLLESTYERCLAYELTTRGLRCEQQRPVHITYGNLVIERAYYIDLLVEDEVVVELKAVEELTPVHKAQVLTHLKWADLQVGLLINFNVTVLRNGLRRLLRG